MGRLGRRTHIAAKSDVAAVLETRASRQISAAKLIIQNGTAARFSDPAVTFRWQVEGQADGHDLLHSVRSLLVATARVRPDREKPAARSSE